jgi:hypothetical protein
MIWVSWVLAPACEETVKGPSNEKRSPGGFQVARAGDTVYVRVSGLGAMSNAPTLKSFVDKMLDEGFRRFLVDLGPCRGVDSTFMGTLLEVATTAREEPDAAGKTGTAGPSAASGSDENEPGVLLVNVDDHCRKQLTSVGLDAFLPIAPNRARLPDGLELRTLEVADVPPQERLRLMVKAHQELIAIDERNEAKFGAFLKDLLANLGH